MDKDKNGKGLSESFIAGVIAIVFLILGFQAALFIHRAAVVRIASNRDAPDTVYIHEDVPSEKYPAGKAIVSGSGEADVSGRNRMTERSNAEHSQVAEAVRNKTPRRHVETFHFNPNTVSVEDLCRLGFSLKQAQSIDNYRKKGGRFRRRSDFAKSYVVSDSIYSRLEPYIDIPLTDLNLADSAAFDALPGIGGWFAKRMIAYRKALGGYSYKEQLMDIPRFDEDKYMALEDLVTIEEENMTSYPLWTLPADSLRHHPYIGNLETARAIVLFRENTGKELWTVANLEAAGILSSSSSERLSRCFIEVP